MATRRRTKKKKKPKKNSTQRKKPKPKFFTIWGCSRRPHLGCSCNPVFSFSLSPSHQAPPLPRTKQPHDHFFFLSHQATKQPLSPKALFIFSATISLLSCDQPTAQPFYLNPTLTVCSPLPSSLFILPSTSQPATGASFPVEISPTISPFSSLASLNLARSETHHRSPSSATGVAPRPQPPPRPRQQHLRPALSAFNLTHGGPAIPRRRRQKQTRDLKRMKSILC